MLFTYHVEIASTLLGSKLAMCPRYIERAFLHHLSPSGWTLQDLDVQWREDSQKECRALDLKRRERRTARIVRMKGKEERRKKVREREENGGSILVATGDHGHARVAGQSPRNRPLTASTGGVLPAEQGASSSASHFPGSPMAAPHKPCFSSARK